MKKYIFVLVMFFCSYANAGTISIHTLSADATLAGVNDNFSTITDEFNGSIEGSTAGSTINIKADTLGEKDMGDDINPRIRANEILDIGVDTTTSQTALVTSGLTPADTANLISDISAGTAYINGFRCDKTATSNTYTASKDTYVDIDQDCTFQFSEVSNGAAEPAVAANSARLALVVTDGTEITGVTDKANRRLSSLVIPINYREGMIVSMDAADTDVLVITNGSIEINNTMITKADVTKLDADVAGDWASGTEDVTTTGYVYVYIDSSGNLKLDDTAPSHTNFAVSKTDGMKRYATITGSTVGRALGYAKRTSSAFVQSDTGNIKEFGTPNSQVVVGTSDITTTSDAYEDMTNMEINFYSSGTRPTLFHFTAPLTIESNEGFVTLDVDGTDKVENSVDGSTGEDFDVSLLYQEILTEGTHTAKIQWKRASASGNFDQDGSTFGDRVLTVSEL